MSDILLIMYNINYTYGLSNFLYPTVSIIKGIRNSFGLIMGVFPKNNCFYSFPSSPPFTQFAN
jgi:hypothetical protein